MKRGTPEHPKMKQLMRVLGIPKYQAVGVMEALWHFAQGFAKRGDIGRWSDAEIAEGIGWKDDPAALVAALVETKWINRCSKHRLVIHDWEAHCDQTVKRAEDVVKYGFVKCVPPKENTDASNVLANASRMLATESTTQPHAIQPEPTPLPLPSPEPSPTPGPVAGEQPPPASLSGPPDPIEADHPAQKPAPVNLDMTAITSLMNQLHKKCGGTSDMSQCRSAVIDALAFRNKDAAAVQRLIDAHPQGQNHFKFREALGKPPANSEAAQFATPAKEQAHYAAKKRREEQDAAPPEQLKDALAKCIGAATRARISTAATAAKEA